MSVPKWLPRADRGSGTLALVFFTSFLALALMGMQGPLLASEADDDHAPKSAFVDTNTRLVRPGRDDHAKAMEGGAPLTIAPGAGRGYMLVGARDTDASDSGLETFPPSQISFPPKTAKPRGFSAVAAFDLDSLELLGRGNVFPHVPFKLLTNTDGTAPPHHLVSDHEGRLLFAPHGSPNGIGGVPVTDNSVEGASRGSICASHAALGSHGGPCTFGVHVIDTQSLEVVRSIPLRIASIGAGAPSPWLRAMSYAPPRGSGDRGKLLLLIEDATTFSVVDASRSPRWTANEAVTYLVQMDPESGEQDWAYRVASCRGQRSRAGMTDTRVCATCRTRPWWHASRACRSQQSS